MKITRVTKSGSFPELSALAEDDKHPSSPTSPDVVGEHNPWWTIGQSDNTSSSTDTLHDLDRVTHHSAPGTDRIDGLKYAAPMAKRGRLFAARINKRRLVQKNGDCNVKSRNVMKRNRKYIVDIFTTLVDMKWRYHLVLFPLVFVVTWCLFAGVWYGIAVVHLDHIYYDNDTWTMCVNQVYDYTSALLFSIETQTTIGYGLRVIQPNCDFGVFLMMLQTCIGLFIQSLVTGVIFAKISRPKGRAQTIMFSEKMAICKRDGEYYLAFRVGDMRKSHIIGTSIRALLVKNRLTTEGESIPLCQYPINLETETSKSDSFVFLIWPVTVVHKIDSTSPLWELSPEKLLTEHFEIIVILEGTVESTGMSTQVRTSYIPSEIMWGERLVPLLTFQLNDGHYQIDYKQFHNTTPTTMPECSAKEYAERRTKMEPVEAQRESDYPVSFTAPAIRPNQSPSRGPLHAIFPRNFDGMIKRRGHGKGKSEEGSHLNRAYIPHNKHSAVRLLEEMHRGGNHLSSGYGSPANTKGGMSLNKVMRLQSLDENPRNATVIQLKSDDSSADESSHYVNGAQDSIL